MVDGLQKLLVPVDRSNSADAAAAYALELARRYGSRLMFCGVVDVAAAIAECSDSTGIFLGAPFLQEIENATKRLLTDTTTRAVEAGVEAESVFLEGRANDEIVSCAKERGIDAIVMGTQGKRGLDRLLLGSTAEGVLRTTLLPTFIVRTAPETLPAGRPWTFERILVAVDDSDAADAALAFAMLLAMPGSRISCCHVVDSRNLLDTAAAYGYDPAPFLDELHESARSLLESRTARVTARGIDADGILAEGPSVDEILETATAARADLIVLGTHARRGIERLFIGSVAEGVIRRSHVPVVVVHGAGRAKPGHGAL